MKTEKTKPKVKLSKFYLIAALAWIPFAIYRLMRLWNDAGGILIVAAPAVLFFVMWFGVQRKEKSEGE